MPRWRTKRSRNGKIKSRRAFKKRSAKAFGRGSRSYRRKVRSGKKGNAYSKYGASKAGITPSQLNKLLTYTCVPSVIPSLGRGCGFNPVKQVRHDTMGTFYYTGLGVFGSQYVTQIVGNSVQDMMDTVGTIQPEGYDLLKGIYDRYCVTGYKVLYRLRDSTDTFCSDSARFYIWHSTGTGTTPANDSYALALQNNDKMQYINTSNVSNSLGGKAKTQSNWGSTGYVDCKKHLATSTGVLFGASGTAVTGGNPNIKVFAKLYAGYNNGYDLGLNDTCYIDLRVIQYVTYFGLQTSVRDT